MSTVVSSERPWTAIPAGAGLGLGIGCERENQSAQVQMTAEMTHFAYCAVPYHHA